MDPQNTKGKETQEQNLKNSLLRTLKVKKHKDRI